MGGLTDPDFVEQQLADGRIAYAAMSRQLIADPAWPDKLRSGQKGTFAAVSAAMQNVWEEYRSIEGPLYL